MFQIAKELIAKMKGVLNDFPLKPCVQPIAFDCSGCSGLCQNTCYGGCMSGCTGNCDTQSADSGGW